ncbi:thioredoxin-like protein [Cristinia sonorae]|uniref:glutathione transferase n=1 Tax=Cristinia sonorae TaxID=1940300 RepID=A0A8K0UL09_9AGAR|nr:thioredoxin-like protein [Cristinia sonorae]
MLTVHHLNNSRSQRLLWLLEELEVPYEIKKYQRGADLLAPKELKQVHPLGLSPIITDGDVTLAESGAIIEYVIEKYGGSKAHPPESGKIHDLYFKHYVEGSLMPLLVNSLIFTIVPQRAPFIIRPLVRPIFNMLLAQMVTPRLKEHAKMIEDHLTKDSKQWLAGGTEPTASDFIMSFALESWATKDPEILGPNTKAYVKRIHERPAYQRGLEKGGEYAYGQPKL